MIVSRTNGGGLGAIWVSGIGQGHVRTGLIRSRSFFAYNFCRNKIARCGWYHCAHLVKTHRLICNCILTFFVIIWPSDYLIWGHLRSAFNLDLSGSTNTCFNASRPEKQDEVRIIALNSSFKSYSQKNMWLLEFVTRPQMSTANPRS